jgi:bacteriorhodopsin
MNTIKRYSGVLWIILAFAAIWFLFSRAGAELSAANVKPDKKIFWYSILPVYTPLMLGLALFGYYSLKGEYDNLGE